MLTAIWLIFWLLVGLLVLVAVILLSPIHIRMTASSDPVQKVRVELRLFSARFPRLFAFDSTRHVADDRVASVPAKPKSKTKPKKKHRKLPRNLSRLIPEIPSTIKNTLRGIHIDALRVRGEFGLGDPADTGQVFGMLAPLIYIPQNPKFNVMLAPNFNTACAHGNAEAALHFTPIRLSLPALKLAWRAFVWPR